MTVEEIHKEESFLAKAVGFAPNVIFFTVMVLFVPWFVESRIHSGVFLASVGFFSFLNFVVIPRATESFFGSKLNKGKQRLEMENRIVSLFFNFSTGIPSYLVWVNMFPLTSLYELEQGRTLIMDVFNAWSIGYVFYDYMTLKRVYGNASALIQWHHVGESMITYSYVWHPELASLYLLSGGCMQFSSGILHIQRIMGFFATKPHIYLSMFKWFLAFIWAHSRLWAFPYCMYIILRAWPIGIVHCLLLTTGVILTLMNAHWWYKIINMKSLAY